MKRVLTAIPLIVAVLAIVFFGPLWSLALAAGVVAALALMEYRTLARAHGAELPISWLIASTALLFGATLRLPEGVLPGLALLAFLLFTIAGVRAPVERVLLDTALGGFGLLYIAYPLTLLPLIKAHDDGPGLLALLFASVWAGDIAALYGGRRFGRHKFAPRLSPNKTWEGAAASVAGSVLSALAVFYAGLALADRGSTALHLSGPAWQAALLAVALNAAAQVGDLLESAIKRGAGVKDSGTLLPGHGGVLDRIDALLLATPVLWFILLGRDWQTLFR